MKHLGFEELKRAMDNRVFGDCGLDIDDVNTENVETNANVDYTVNGVFYTYATDAEIDLSALTGLPTAALATNYTQVMALYIDASGTITVDVGEARLTQSITDGDTEADFPANADDKALFGYIKVVNATGSDFTWGTTGLDTAGTTVTYYSVSGAVDNSDGL